MSDDVGLDMHRAAEKHLNAVWDAFYDQEDAPDVLVESPSYGPFCGCTTCVVREVLTAAYPVMENHFRTSE